jgi:hypothetical protein
MPPTAPTATTPTATLPSPVRASWSDARDDLLALAAGDLDAGTPPLPTLLGFTGDDALAIVTLRPCDRDELVQALLEVLALLLPLGADRIAVSFPGRAWSVEDGMVAADAPEPRSPVLLVTLADAAGGPCQTSTSIHPFEEHAVGWEWLAALYPDEDPDPEPAAIVALRLLLDAREQVTSEQQGDLRIPAQFGRVLLLGHQVALAPLAAERLERHTNA